MDTQSPASDDLAFIRRVMADSRAATALSGRYFAIWGSISFAALVLTWWLVGRQAPAPAYWATWAAAGFAGGLLTAVQARRDARSSAVRAASARLGQCWMGVGLSMLLCFFVGTGSGTIDARAMNGLVSLFLGLGIWVNGTLLDSRLMRGLAWLWWLAAAALLWWPGRHGMLVVAGLTLVAYVLPGWWLGRAAATPADGDR